jgi:exportin-1
MAPFLTNNLEFGNKWDNVLQQAGRDVSLLSTPDTVKTLSNILKTNVSACTSIGQFFTPQLGRIYMDILGLYKAVSQIVSESIVREGDSPPFRLLSHQMLIMFATGPIATKTPIIRGLRTIKKDILRLFDTYIKKAEDLAAVNDDIMPALLEAVLGDYSRNVPASRDAEVLNTMVTITNRLGVRGILSLFLYDCD